MPARAAISRVVAPPNPRSANTASAASRTRWRVSAVRSGEGAAASWLTEAYRSVRGALLARPASCQGKTRDAARRGSAQPGTVVDVVAGALEANPRPDEAGAGELHPRESVVVADDDRHRRAHRRFEHERGEVDLHQREADLVACQPGAAPGVLDHLERSHSARRLRVVEGEALAVARRPDAPGLDDEPLAVADRDDDLLRGRRDAI